MQRADVVTQKLTGPFFPDPLLRIRQFTAVRYVAGKPAKDWTDPAKPALPAAITLSVPALGLQSPLLAYKDSFFVDFPTPGVYTVHCLQLPGAAQKVIVSEEPDFPELESDSNETISVENAHAFRRPASTSRDAVWAKRPRNRRKTPLEKRKVECVESLSSAGSRSSRFKKSSKASGGSDRAPESPLNSVKRVSDAPDPIVKPSMTSQADPCDSSTPRSTQELTGSRLDDPDGTPDTPNELADGREVLEWVRFKGLSSQAVEAVLSDLKARFEVNNENFDQNGLVFGSFAAFDGWAGGLLEGFVGEPAVPKGQVARRLRRNHQRMEARISG